MLPQGKEPLIVTIVKGYTTTVKIRNISVVGMKQKSYIHFCDAVQGVGSLTFVTKDIVRQLLKYF